MTVYVDILVFVNTLVNYFMLSAVKIISREKASRLRILSGAFLGGASSLLIFADFTVMTTLLKVLLSFLMIFVSFKFTGIKRFLKKVLWLFLISFVFGGVMFFIKSDLMLYENGIVYFDVDLTSLVVCSVLSYLAVTLISKLCDKKAPKEKEYYVAIEKNGKCVSDTGLMDTGNNLREPFSGYPVILIDKKIFSQLFDGGNFRLVPVTTVNGASVVKAFKPDRLKIGSYITDKAYIAESAVPIDEYKIILNINLEEEIRNENQIAHK